MKGDLKSLKKARMLMNKLRIDPNRPMEELVGDNKRYVRWKLGQIHCMTNFREAARKCRLANRKDVPVALRRGLLKCVWDTLEEYRETYLSVMNGRVGRG